MPAPLPSKTASKPSIPEASRSAPAVDAPLASKARGKKRQRATSSAIDDGDATTGEEPDSSAIPTSRRSTRARRAVQTSYRETDSDEEPTGDGEDQDDTLMDEDPEIKLEPDKELMQGAATSAEPIDLSAQLSSDEDDEKNKPKMQMNLTYEGFPISNYKLCLIVQPFPALSRPSDSMGGVKRSDSLLPARQASIAHYTTAADRGSSMPPPVGPGTSMRDARSVTPAPFRGTPLFREPSPAFADRGETPQSSYDHPSHGFADDDDDGDLAVIDDSLDGLKQLTQSFRGRDENIIDTLGLGGNDEVDFDADADGVMAGDADD